MDRIEEIRERADLLRDAASIGLGAEKVVDFFEEDFPWLLERVGELERENENLKREAEGLHTMIQQAIHPQSE